MRQTDDINFAVPAKLPSVTVYIPEKVKASLEKLAVLERRSNSSMAAILIEEALKNRGLIEAEEMSP